MLKTIIPKLLPVPIVVLMVTAGTVSPCLAASKGELEKLRSRALELVNKARREQGLPPLELGRSVNEAALSHANDMLQRHYYSHTSPEGNTVQDRYIAAGGSEWRLTAENIARCPNCSSTPDIDMVERLHRGWMDSPEHRQNILRNGLTRFGFGAVSGAGSKGQYAVQTFAGPGVPRGLKEGESAIAISPREQTQAALSKFNAVRTAKGRAPLQSSAALIDLANSAVATPDSDGLIVRQSINLFQLLPASQRRSWRAMSLLAAACGGCGTDPTSADAAYFVELWLDNQQHRQTLLDGQSTHLGLKIAANGVGKKVAIAVFGQHR